MSDIFTVYQAYIEKEQATVDSIKTIVSDIDETARRILFALQVIHVDFSARAKACSEARDLFDEVCQKFDKLNETVPKYHFGIYHDCWKHTVQKLCFGAALVVWLENGILIKRDTAAALMRINVRESDGIMFLELEDFLIGILVLVTELTRLAVNSVTMGDYQRPIQISVFINEINNGFKLLKLKNNSLRKRYDVLKYDIKKIEEVVYDLGMRGLILK